MNTYAIIFFFLLFVSPTFAADGGGGGGATVAANANLLALLAPLLSTSVINTSGSGSFPWQQTFVETISTEKFLFFSWLLHDIPGLVAQCRHALFQSVNNVGCSIRKIPGSDITWRVFVCADDDLDPTNFSETSLLDFIRTHPGAAPQYTLDKDTTQSTIQFSVPWLIGLGASVTTVLPPLRVPRLVVFAESSANLKNKQISVAFTGNVDIAGYGYVAGHVAPAPGP